MQVCSLLDFSKKSGFPNFLAAPGFDYRFVVTKAVFYSRHKTKKSSFFVFIFCKTLFYSDTKQKVGPKFLCFGILKHKKGSKFVSEERRNTKHKIVHGEEGGRMACSSGRVEWEGDRFQ